jgi:hypothetical protein
MDRAFVGPADPLVLFPDSGKPRMCVHMAEAVWV